MYFTFFMVTTLVTTFYGNAGKKSFSIDRTRVFLNVLHVSAPKQTCNYLIQSCMTLQNTFKKAESV